MPLEGQATVPSKQTLFDAAAMVLGNARELAAKATGLADALCGEMPTKEGKSHGKADRGGGLIGNSHDVMDAAMDAIREADTALNRIRSMI